MYSVLQIYKKSEGLYPLILFVLIKSELSRHLDDCSLSLK